VAACSFVSGYQLTEEPTAFFFKVGRSPRLPWIWKQYVPPKPTKPRGFLVKNTTS